MRRSDTVTPRATSRRGARRIGRALSVTRHAQTGLVRLIGSVLQLALGVLIPAWLGTAVLGQFYVFVAIANLAMILSSGLPNLMLRYASPSVDVSPSGHPHYRDQTGWLWRISILQVLVSLVVAAVAFVLGAGYVAAVAAAVGGLTLQRVSSATVKAGGRPNTGVLMDSAAYPATLLVILVVARTSGWQLSADALIVGFLAAVWLCAFGAIVVDWRSLASARGAVTAPRTVPGPVVAELAALTLSGGANVISTNAPLAVAPLFLTHGEIGVLGLALRVAGFATTVLVGLVAYFGPAFANASAPAELRELRRKSQFACTILYVPIVFGALLVPESWLQALGHGFAAAKPVMVILALGYLVNAMTGLAPTMLVMRGRTRIFLATNIVNAVLTVSAVALGAVLGGITGIAIGLSVVMTIVNVWTFRASTAAIAAAGS